MTSDSEPSFLSAGCLQPHPVPGTEGRKRTERIYKVHIYLAGWIITARACDRLHNTTFFFTRYWKARGRGGGGRGITGSMAM